MRHEVQLGQWTRRRFAMALPLFGALPWAVRSGNASAGPQRASRTLMGTKVDIVTDGGDVHLQQAAIQKAFAHMQRLEGLMSRYRSDSIVSQLNARAGQRPMPVPPEVMAVLQQAQRVFHGSQGAFDPTVGALVGWQFEPGAQRMPSQDEITRELASVGGQFLQLDSTAGTAYLARSGMALDLGGIAKLPILEAGLRVLKQEGVGNALLNGGGDVLAMGRLSGRPWRVGVRDPRTPAQMLGVIEVEGFGVVASSGDYERSFMRGGRLLHHVLDPKTGWPTQGVHGITLFARNVEAVNGWGTALMVQGAAAVPKWSQQNTQVDVLAAGANGDVWRSAGMQMRMKPLRA